MAFLSVTVAVLGIVECVGAGPRLVCREDGGKRNGGEVCLDRENDATIVYTCEDGYYCPPLYHLPSVHCQPSPPVLPQSYPGEPCLTNSSCISTTCAQGVCTGSGHMQPCMSHTDCDTGLFCSPFRHCMKQMSQRAPINCRDEYDCQNSFTCRGGRCIPYFSLLERDLVYECYNNQSLACNSGLCYNHRCLKAVRSDGELPVRCGGKGGCRASWYSSEEHEFGFEGECECAWDEDGSSICTLFPGDPPYQAYLQQLSYFLERNLQCHTLRRMSSYCMRKSLSARRFRDLAASYYLVIPIMT